MIILNQGPNGVIVDFDEDSEPDERERFLNALRAILNNE
jgi:hypothetical protein